MTRERLVVLLSSSLDARPELVGGGVLIGHTPDVAPLAYLHRLYPVLSRGDLVGLADSVGRPVPPDYATFLCDAGNGARLFALHLYGYVGQLRRDASDPLGQPVSLSYGNVVERPSGLDDETLAIGGMVGWSARGCLVMTAARAVLLVHPIDGRDVAASWPSLDAMLEDEIARCSALYYRDGRCLVSSTEVMHPGGRKWETSVEPRQRRPN